MSGLIDIRVILIATLVAILTMTIGFFGLIQNSWEREREFILEEVKRHDIEIQVIKNRNDNLMKRSYDLSYQIELAIPREAIVAFTKPCEELDGWEDYSDSAGKFLLGAGRGVLRPRGPHKPSSELSEIQLSEVKAGDQGGEEAHILTTNEMPEHNHDSGSGKYLVTITGNLTKENTDSKGGNEINIKDGVKIRAVGKGMPHNNMPPYVALYFCRRGD